MAKRNRQAKKARTKDPVKEAAKRARREQRKALEAAAKAKAERKRKAKLATLWVAGLAIAAFALAGAWRAFFPPELEGVESPPNEGRTHVPAGQAVSYPTATPTSGSHSAQSPRCGIFRTPLPLEQAVHALEHGVVIVWYQEARGDELADPLADIVLDFDDRVILSPNPALDRPIVATAWNRLKSYDDVDPEIAEFIDTYRNRGPERVPCEV